MKTFFPKHATQAFITVIAALSIGGVIGATAFALTRPPSIPHTPTISEVPITTESFTDDQPVQLTVTPQQHREITITQPGLVTQVSCEPHGGILRSGTVPIHLNGSPVLALSTTTPLWRNLNYTDSGPDVDALKTELERLGYPVSPGNQYLWREAQAVSLLTTGQSVQAHTTELNIQKTMWLPQHTVTVADCSLGLGAYAAENRSTFATVEQPPTVTLTPALTRDTEERIIRVADIELQFTDHETQSLSQESLQSLLASQEYVTAQQSTEPDAPVRIPAVASLVTSHNAALVPPSALTIANDNQGCVAHHGTPILVNIAQSRLGQTVVLFAAETDIPSTVDVAGPTTCG